MKLLLEQFGIAWLGLVTTLLVVVTDIAVLRWSGFSLVATLVNWMPVGAICGGMVAASGYYIGARYTHSRATPFLLLLMGVIAGYAYFLIFWLDYMHSPVRDLMTFWEFVEVILTNTRITDRTEGVGSIGYLLGLVDFIGFLCGGFGVYALLASRHMCPSCSLYLNILATSKKEFVEVDALISYIDSIEASLPNLQMSVTTRDNLVAVRERKAEAHRLGIGVVETSQPMRVGFELFGCHFCKHQTIERKVSIRNQGTWDDIKSLRQIFQVPPGVDAKSHLS